MTERHYHRCQDCLTPLVADKVLATKSGYHRPIGVENNTRCGICGGPLEYMGRVANDRVVTDHVACKCDERCVSATGPNCSCACGGKNHGAQFAGYVQYTKDHGPALMPGPKHNVPKAKQRAQEYRDALRAAIERLHALPAWRAFSDNTWVQDKKQWWRCKREKNALLKAQDARTHKGRLTKLADVAAEGGGQD